MNELSKNTLRLDSFCTKMFLVAYFEADLPKLLILPTVIRITNFQCLLVMELYHFYIQGKIWIPGL